MNADDKREDENAASRKIGLRRTSKFAINQSQNSAQAKTVSCEEPDSSRRQRRAYLVFDEGRACGRKSEPEQFRDHAYRPFQRGLSA
jgi:hypothetical protein